MDEFKQWHDEDLTFHTESNVYFSQCNRRQELSLNEVLRLTSDIAVEDYRQRGMDREFLVEKGFYILVSRSAFRFHRLPHENEHIMVTTWEEKPEALQLMRTYEIVSKSGEKLITGYSSWLLVDPVARRIVPTKKFTLRPETTKQTEHDSMKIGKILVPEEMQLLDRRTIHYSDIDGNGHTNNSRYGAFIMDALPVEYAEKHFTDFRINYAKEAMLGEKMSILANIDDGAKKITVVGKTESDVSFESELYWK